jgi:hypothetical protein
MWREVAAKLHKKAGIGNYVNNLLDRPTVIGDGPAGSKNSGNAVKHLRWKDLDYSSPSDTIQLKPSDIDVPKAKLLATPVDSRKNADSPTIDVNPADILPSNPGVTKAKLLATPEKPTWGEGQIKANKKFRESQRRKKAPQPKPRAKAPQPRARAKAPQPRARAKAPQPRARAMPSRPSKWAYLNKIKRPVTKQVKAAPVSKYRLKAPSPTKSLVQRSRFNRLGASPRVLSSLWGGAKLGLLGAGALGLGAAAYNVMGDANRFRYGDPRVQQFPEYTGDQY